MLDEKQSAQRVSEYLREGKIIKEKGSKFIYFFANNAKISLDSANLLWNVSNDKELQTAVKMEGFNGYLWVINSSYYSMFYMAHALLESAGIKIKKDVQGVHEITYHCLVNYFYSAKKLQKAFIEDFKEASEEATELLGQQKAEGLMEDYKDEKAKRGIFTYTAGIIVVKQKAETSLNRAKRFYSETRKLIK